MQVPKIWVPCTILDTWVYLRHLHRAGRYDLREIYSYLGESCGREEYVMVTKTECYQWILAYC